MDFTHKFASGPMPIDRLISEYFNPGKVRRNGSQAAYVGKRYSNPPFSFKEQDFLNKFKYLYPIGREFEIPREDRQKVIGTSNVNTYKRQITEAINLQSWNDLIRFEQEHPGTLALVPGPCQVCERTHEGCNRPKNQPCRHMDLMRFSLEGLGIDADTMAKFEMGLLPKWPDDGKLPQKLTAVMGILSNELIPMEEIKAFFPDAEKNFLNLAERESLDPNLLSPEIKRQTSWLDNQVRQRKALEEAEAKRLQAEQQASLPSEHLKDAPKPESELPTEHIGNKTFEAGMPNEHIVQKGSQPDAFDEDDSEKAEGEEDEDKKYKWLGFKRSLDEVNQNFYNRPIPKFNVPDEEEEEEAEPEEELSAQKPIESVPEVVSTVEAPAEPAAAQSEEEDEDSGLNYSFKRPIMDEEEVPNTGGIPKWKTNPALLPDEEEEEAADETQPKTAEGPEPAETVAVSAPEAPQYAAPTAAPSASPAPDTMQSLLESLDVDMLKKVLAAKLMESGEMSAEDLRAQREREAAQAKEREEEQRRAAIEQAMNEKRAQAEARAQEAKAAAEAEAARRKAEEEAREAEKARKQEELEGMLRARLEEERARIEEEKRIEAEKKAEEERIRAEEAAKKAEEERLAREEQARLEAQKLPEVSGLDNVLGMALNIAKQVSKSEEPQAEEAQTQDTPAQEAPAPKAQEKRPPVRHSYKWLNYKSELKDDEDEPLKDWKER